MSQPKTFTGKYRQNGMASHYARIAAANGSGAATGIEGEGRYVQVADVDEIELTVIEKLTGDVVLAATALTPSAVVLDSVVTSTAVWTQGGGYNFLHHMPEGSYPESGKVYRTQYKITLNGDYDPLYLIFEGPALKTN